MLVLETPRTVFFSTRLILSCRHCPRLINQRINGPVNALLISGPTVSTKKKQILTSIKGRNSVANLRNTIIYNTNIDLVNDDVYTKFGLIL